jgi:hypothetical protein
MSPLKGVGPYASPSPIIESHGVNLNVCWVDTQIFLSFVITFGSLPVKKAIYTGLVNGFEEVEFGGPVPCKEGASFDCVSPTPDHSVRSHGPTGVLLSRFC